MGLVLFFFIVITTTAGSDTFCPGRIPVVCSFEPFIFTFPERDLTSYETNQLEQAKKACVADKDRRARILFSSLYKERPDHPKVSNAFGEFLEKYNEDQKANHCFLLAYKCGLDEAKVSYERTLARIQDQFKADYNFVLQRLNDLKEALAEHPSPAAIKDQMDALELWHSNAIEGNTMTLEETKTVLNGKFLDVATIHNSIRPSIQLSEILEVIGQKNAFMFLEKMKHLAPSKISESTIKKIHRYILGNIDPDNAGIYRSEQVRVGTFYPPAPEEVPALMQSLISWFQSPEFQGLNPIEAAALAHYQFVWIHPFVDGNGRTARMLMNLILQHHGLPHVVVDSGERLDYYYVLKQAQMKEGGDTWPFVQFISQSLSNTIQQHFSLLAKKPSPEKKEL
jgi:Fic family protein